MIRMSPPKRPFDVLHPPAGTPTLGTGAAAGAMPQASKGPVRMRLDDAGGNTVFDENFTVADAAHKLRDALKNEPPEDQRAILEGLQRKYRDLPTKEKLRRTEKRISELEAEQQSLREFEASALELMRWQKAGLTLQRPKGSVMHHLLDALHERRVRLLFKEAAGLPGSYGRDLGNLAGQGTHAFVVEHDWAAVFDGAQEFSGNDFRLPFDSMCFEFRISGLNVCAMITGNEERKLLAPFVEPSAGWILPKYAYVQDGDGPWRPTVTHARAGGDEFEPLRNLLCSQIRAICISLDAEVSTTEVIRAPFRLNRSREKRGRAPIADYHVIKLAHRHRVLPREEDGAVEPGTRKRLHFRRGHWRHYATHKTWIRWTLVGDPELGFIDKHYRL